MKDGQVKVKGECYDGVLPRDQSHSSWMDVEFHKDDNKKKQKIVHMSGARILAAYVTEEGRLFCQGFNYLNFVESYKDDLYDYAQEVKLPDKTKCLRAWAVSETSEYDIWAVYVEL